MLKNDIGKEIDNYHKRAINKLITERVGIEDNWCEMILKIINRYCIKYKKGADRTTVFSLMNDVISSFIFGGSIELMNNHPKPMAFFHISIKFITSHVFDKEFGLRRKIKEGKLSRHDNEGFLHYVESHYGNEYDLVEFLEHIKFLIKVIERRIRHRPKQEIEIIRESLLLFIDCMDEEGKFSIYHDLANKFTFNKTKIYELINKAKEYIKAVMQEDPVSLNWVKTYLSEI